MFGEIDDLSDVVGVVRHLAVDGLHDGMRLGADISGAGEIGVGQRGQRVKRKLPARFPECKKLRRAFSAALQIPNRDRDRVFRRRW